MDRDDHYIPATERGPVSSEGQGIPEKIAGELLAALDALEDSEPHEIRRAWHRRRLIDDLASLGDVGIVQLKRLHSSASGSQRLMFLAGLLSAGDGSSLEMDLPLLIALPRLNEVEEEFVSRRFGSLGAGVTALQAAKVLTSTSPGMRAAAANVLNGMANSEKQVLFDRQAFELMVQKGLADADRLVRYDIVAALGRVTKLQGVPSVTLFESREGEYLDFWKRWGRRGGIETFLKAASTSPPSPAVVPHPPVNPGH
jgi:hypothetical protein